MSIQTKYPMVRWAVPVAVVGIAVGGTVIATQMSAGASSTLAPRSAAQLLVDVQTARLSAGSGTVVEKADLGLPQLPTPGGGAGSSDLSSLIAGNHTLRLWYSGQTKARVALMGTLGESDVIRDGRDLWTWSSQDNSATHRTLPADVDKDAPQSLGDLAAQTTAGGANKAVTPQQAADQVLAAISPTTAVTTSVSAQVAGRDAYELVLSGKDPASLIGRVTIAVDAEQHVPLRVQVFAKNATTPSVEVGFTQISFAKPADSQFTFTPPPNVKMTEGSVPLKSAATAGGLKAKDAAEPVISGKGWTSVVQLSAPKLDSQLGTLEKTLPRVSGTWGSGRLLRAKMFSVLLIDDGRVLAGPVAPERLYQAASQPTPDAKAKPGAKAKPDAKAAPDAEVTP